MTAKKIASIEEKQHYVSCMRKKCNCCSKPQIEACRRAAGEHLDPRIVIHDDYINDLILAQRIERHIKNGYTDDGR